MYIDLSLGQVKFPISSAFVLLVSLTLLGTKAIAGPLSSSFERAVVEYMNNPRSETAYNKANEALRTLNSVAVFSGSLQVMEGCGLKTLFPRELDDLMLAALKGGSTMTAKADLYKYVQSVKESCSMY